ncbi:MAG: ribonuclease H-like domain-containing protein [Candidatus Woesearchaeota archaeon]
MITHSFSFLEKINKKTEESLWSMGIKNWDDFISARSIKGMSSLRKGYYDRFLEKAKRNLEFRNEAFFFDRIPLKETWRLYDYFKDQAIYLDIETSSYNTITVVGLYDGSDSRILIHGFNLDKDTLKEALSDCKMIITFNGSCFDIPFIKRYFSEVVPSVPHLDLRFAASQLGLTGGLKNIEKQIGISRGDQVKDVRGGDAVVLWDMWKRTGDKKYLDILVEYNKEDIVNLKPLAEYVVSGLKKVQNSYFMTALQ